jgi:hypothetical protein
MLVEICWEYHQILPCKLLLENIGEGKEWLYASSRSSGAELPPEVEAQIPFALA